MASISVADIGVEYNYRMIVVGDAVAKVDRARRGKSPDRQSRVRRSAKAMKTRWLSEGTARRAPRGRDKV